MRWLLVLWLAIAPACAQEAVIGSGVSGGVKAAATYTGPGDIVSGALVWYGLRAYSAATAATGTQKSINLRNTSSNETCDVLTTTAGGLATTVANCSGSSSGNALTTFCGTCAVTEIYDQSGNANNISQATAANQPTWAFSCLSSFPCWKSAAGKSIQGSNVSLSGSVTLTAEFNITTTASGPNAYVFSTFVAGACVNAIQGNTSANNFNLVGNANPLAVSANNNTTHSVIGVVAGASTVANVDGTETTGTTTLCTANNKPPGFITGGGTTFNFNGFEDGAWNNTTMNSTQRTNMHNNMCNYWGTSC